MRKHPFIIKVLVTVVLFMIVAPILGLLSTFALEDFIISHALQVTVYAVLLIGLFFGIYKAIKFIWHTN